MLIQHVKLFHITQHFTCKSDINSYVRFEWGIRSLTIRTYSRQTLNKDTPEGPQMLTPSSIQFNSIQFGIAW